MGGFWIFADNVPMLENYFPYAVQLFFYFFLFMIFKEIIGFWKWKKDYELAELINGVEYTVKVNAKPVKTKPVAEKKKKGPGRPRKIVQDQEETQEVQEEKPVVGSNPLHL